MHTIKTKSPYIGSSETLVVLARLGGELRVCEGDPIGTCYQNARAVMAAHDEETITNFKRLYLDRDTVEDITEEIAEAYIAADQTLRKTDVHCLPVYVQKSQAWSDYYYDETPSVPDYVEHSTYRVVNGRVA